MCLLIVQPEGTKFSDAFLRGAYRKNSDGLGVMYAENKVLKVHKILPRNADDVIEFFREHVDGRAAAIHFRMKTHGLIDLDNCHPYEVLGQEDGVPIYLMHNGVLSTGNAADTTKSDTWHYIRNFVRPILKENPALLTNPAFQKMMEGHIGSGNKFALMDAFGNIVTINEKAGVKYNGAWLSNTYAWDTTGTEHAPKTYGGYGGGYNRALDDDWDAPYYSRKGGGNYSTYGAVNHKPGTSVATVTDINKGATEKKPESAVVAQQDGIGKLTFKELEDRETWVDLMIDVTDVLFSGDDEELVKHVTYFPLRGYYTKVGGTRAWELLEMISRNEVDEHTLIEAIKTGRAAPDVLKEREGFAVTTLPIGFVPPAETETPVTVGT